MGLQARTERVTYAVALAPVVDSAPGSRAGLTNIFFATPGDSVQRRGRLGAAWAAVELADVVAADGLLPVHVARYKSPDDSAFRYVVDTAGTLDFTGGQQLEFRRERSVRVADIRLTVRSVSGVVQRLPYQILLADDRYAYARIAEYRAGRITVDGRQFLLRVRPRSRNHPFYSVDPGTVLLADIDGDGQISEQAAGSVGGRPAAAEQVTPGTPFRLGRRPLQLAQIDSAGTRLILRQWSGGTAAVEGFRAPALRGEHLAGGQYELPRRPGDVTLVEFWATDCPYSARVRPATNALAASLGGQRFRWVGVVKGSDREAIRAYLATHPVGAEIVLADSATWAAYNPEASTPLFVVIDSDGTVRHRAMGAFSMDSVAARVRRLLRVPPP
jgi:thiol-disulfide isomerase/thioredoxin